MTNTILWLITNNPTIEKYHVINTIGIKEDIRSFTWLLFSNKIVKAMTKKVR